MARLDRSTDDPIINNRLVSRPRQILATTHHPSVYRFYRKGGSCGWTKTARAKVNNAACFNNGPVAQTVEICFFFPGKLPLSGGDPDSVAVAPNLAGRSLRERRRSPTPPPTVRLNRKLGLFTMNDIDGGEQRTRSNAIFRWE